MAAPMSASAPLPRQGAVERRGKIGAGAGHAGDRIVGADAARIIDFHAKLILRLPEHIIAEQPEG